MSGRSAALAALALLLSGCAASLDGLGGGELATGVDWSRQGAIAAMVSRNGRLCDNGELGFVAAESHATELRLTYRGGGLWNNRFAAVAPADPGDYIAVYARCGTVSLDLTDKLAEHPPIADLLPRIAVAAGQIVNAGQIDITTTGSEAGWLGLGSVTKATLLHLGVTAAVRTAQAKEFDPSERARMVDAEPRWRFAGQGS